VITRLATAANIPNATAIPARAEEWAIDHRATYDTVTARALAALPILLEYAAPLLALGGVLVAWKGARDPAEERSAAKAAETLGMTLLEVIPVRPFKGSQQRHLYVYAKESPTPARFPRRPGMATKRPLPQFGD
jgi:16S rRNA (guanine527-N7)-methyltransferase